MTRDEMHAHHQPSCIYENGCILCDLVEQLHLLIDINKKSFDRYTKKLKYKKKPPVDIPSWSGIEGCIIETISSIKKIYYWNVKNDVSATVDSQKLSKVFSKNTVSTKSAKNKSRFKH